MKKLFIVALATASLGYIGCKKKTNEPAALGTATVKGRLVADIDQTNDTSASGVFSANSVSEGAEGVRVYATINYYYLQATQSGGTGQYAEKTVETTTDANGNFTLEVPVGARSYSLRVNYDDFNATKTFTDAQGNDLGTAEYRYEFPGNNYTDVVVSQGAMVTIETRDAGTGFSVDNSNVPTTTGSGTFESIVYINDLIVLPGDTNQMGNDSVVYEFAPEGTVVTIGIDYDNNSGMGVYDAWMTATIGANGVLNLQIPTSSGPTGNSEFEIFFPDLLLEYSNTRDMPNVIENQVFEASYSTTINNGGFVLEQEIFYTEQP